MTESPETDNFALYPELKHLLRALQMCQGFGLYFTRCNAVSLRNELVATLKATLNKPIIELALNPENDIFIDAQMTELLANASDDAVVFIYDLEKLFYLKDRHVIQELNWRRGFYGRSNHPIVFWLPEFVLTEIVNEAPDFADWRSGLYEFNLSQSERLDLMISTWQSVNENFVEQLSLSEKQRWIVNIQNLLAELADQESSKVKDGLLDRLGQLYDSLGDYDQALSCYQQALQISQDIGDRLGEGTTLNNLALIAHAKGDYDSALHYLTQTLEIDRELGNKKDGCATFNNISLIHSAKGDYDTALQYLTQAMQISQDIGDKRGEGATLNNISQIYQAKGDFGTALQYLKQSLKICKDNGNKAGVSATLNNISQIYQAIGDYDIALQYLKQTLQITQDIGDKRGEGKTLNNISQIHQAKGDYGTALKYLMKALKIMQDIGDKPGECTTLFNIGYIHYQHNDLHQAQSIWLKSYHIAKQIGLAQGLQNLDKLAKNLGGEGLAYWEALSSSSSKA
ncbi:MAG: tetratricopeptide repeat protein [Methylobacter sp.]|nr:tetratricopeptide repeat protein [Methylobacter sp.]